jgi:CBS domain containing-hemolysin-like protein
MILAIFLISLLFVGFFAGMETAFVSANRLTVELKKKQGKRSGIILARLLDNPFHVLASCIVGYNLFLVVYGVHIENVLTPFWKLSGLQVVDQNGLLKLLASVLLATLCIMIVEFAFRALFRAKNDGTLSLFAGVLDFFHTVFRPIAQALVSVSGWILKYIFNLQIEEHNRPFNRIDLEHYFMQTREMDEESQDLNQELFENALSLPGVKVRSCLVPRREVVAVDKHTPISQVITLMVESQLSKIVVYEGNIDTIVGYVHQLDMFKKPSSVADVLLPIPTVPETMSVSDLISKFSREHKSIAWVVDEFGGTAGIVTMEDLLEEIFGEIHDEFDTEVFTEQQVSDGEFIFSGRVELDGISEKYNISFPEGSPETLSGYIIGNHDIFPKKGEHIIIGDYQFEILEATHNRVELVKLKVLK